MLAIGFVAGGAIMFMSITWRMFREHARESANIFGEYYPENATAPIVIDE